MKWTNYIHDRLCTWNTLYSETITCIHLIQTPPINGPQMVRVRQVSSSITSSVVTYNELCTANHNAQKECDYSHYIKLHLQLWCSMTTWSLHPQIFEVQWNPAIHYGHHWDRKKVSKRCWWLIASCRSLAALSSGSSEAFCCCSLVVSSVA